MYAKLLNFEASLAIAVQVFLFVILLGFIKLLFRGDYEERTLQKIIGGLATFVVALLSGHWVVMTTSLFIGGLIIASEDFMEFVVSILRSSPDKVHKTVEAFDVRKATKTEIEEKRMQEETTIATAKNVSSKRKPPKAKTQMRQSALVEENIHKYLSKEYGDKYERDLRIATNPETILDAGIWKKSDKTEPLQEGIEIKVLENNWNLIRIVTDLVINRIELSGIQFPIRIVLAIKDLDLDKADDLFEKIIDKFGARDQFRFSIFSYDKNEEVDFRIGSFY